MYEQLVNELISFTQVDGNLRRSIEKGLISHLNRIQMNKLALKYFGVDQKGNYTSNTNEIVGYRCPYTGEIVNSNLHLEHILPISSNGGTVLFNCIPVSYQANISKHDTPNLIDWWTRQSYFDYDRLERLIQYVLEAYEISDKSINEDEYYSDIEIDYIEENDNLTLSEYKYYLTNKKQNNEKITYFQLISSMIDTLATKKDISVYNTKLSELKNNGKFGEIEKLEEIINIVNNIIKEKTNEDSKKYLSYSLEIDIKRLYDSLKTDDYENEIRKRIVDIENIISENNISINDYFENLGDIDEINPLYYDSSQLSKKAKSDFIENIRIGKDTKILIFIDMVRQAKTSRELEQLLNGHNNNMRFTTYKEDEKGNIVENKKYGLINRFYITNKGKIQPILDRISQEDSSFKNILDDYYMNTPSGNLSPEGNQRRIDVFIDMIKNAKTSDDLAQLFSSTSTMRFTTYKEDEHGNIVEDKKYGLIGNFYRSNKDKIQPILDRISQEDLKFRDKFSDYYIKSCVKKRTIDSTKRRINVFVDMIKYAKTSDELVQILSDKSTMRFTTYKKDEHGNIVIDKKYDSIGKFYTIHKDKIKPILDRISQKDLTFKNKLDDYYLNTRSGSTTLEGRQRRINVFIDMIRYAKTSDDLAQLFSSTSTMRFTTYKEDEHGNIVEDKKYGLIGDFYRSNKDKIQPIIDKISQEDFAFRDVLDNYYMDTFNGQCTSEGIQRRLDVFIEMIKQTKTSEELEQLFSYNSLMRFTTYKEDEHGNIVEDKKYGFISRFYEHTKNRIQPILDKLSQEDLNFRDKIDDYYMNTRGGQRTPEGIQRRLDVFIKMINQVRNLDTLKQLFSFYSKMRFTTYKKDTEGNMVVDKIYGPVSQYWRNKGLNVISSLYFSDDYSDSSYDVARNNVIIYLNYLQNRKKLPEFSNIYEYILTLDATKKEVKELIKLRDQMLERKNILISENEQLKEQLDSTSVRRAV